MRRGRQPEEDISRAKKVMCPKFLYQASLMEKRHLAMQMRSCEDKLKGKTAHFRLPSASQKRACLSSLFGWTCSNAHDQERKDKTNWKINMTRVPVSLPFSTSSSLCSLMGKCGCKRPSTTMRNRLISISSMVSHATVILFSISQVTT